MKRYDNYKPSGIEWLGDIPEHWEVKRFKDIAYSITGLTYSPNDIVNENEGVLVLRSGNVQNGELSFNDNVYVNCSISKKLIVKSGDILICARNGSANLVGKSAYIYHNYNYSWGAFMSVARSKMRKYLYYELNSILLKNNMGLFQTSTVNQLTSKMLDNMAFLSPYNFEQTAIANYLDNKTTAIDSKITLLTAKSERYKALRRSLINETVCRGISSESFTQSETLTRYKLKDSGIEWIGKIPEHWEVKRVKEVFDISRGRVIGQQELIDDGMYPVYSSQTENDGCLGYINTYDYNATLLTWTTDGANAGTVFKRTGKSNCTNVCGILKPKKQDFNLDYILYVLQVSASHNKRIDTNGAKIMSNEMSVIPLIYPPICEQTAIANYLDEQTTQIDTILSNISQQISKLTQFRKILINEVVTGKIKVVED